MKKDLFLLLCGLAIAAIAILGEYSKKPEVNQANEFGPGRLKDEVLVSDQKAYLTLEHSTAAGVPSVTRTFTVDPKTGEVKNEVKEFCSCPFWAQFPEEELNFFGKLERIRLAEQISVCPGPDNPSSKMSISLDHLPTSC